MRKADLTRAAERVEAAGMEFGAACEDVGRLSSQLDRALQTLRKSSRRLRAAYVEFTGLLVEAAEKGGE